MNSSANSAFVRHRLVTLACINIAGIVALLCASELLVRLCCPQIKPFYLSAHLIQKNMFGPSFGMAPNQRGFTGSAVVVTDRYGFRMGPESPAFDAKLPTILFLGDSVLFGHGVAAEQTFIEIIKQQLKGHFNVIGASAPGWDIDDYVRVIQHFVLPRHASLNIASVVIVYCFNDISALSASAIQSHLNNQTVQTDAGGAPLPTRIRNRLWALKKKYNAAQSINDFFNRYSRLFILVKRHVLDQAQGYYAYESKNYENDQLLERLRGKITMMQEALSSCRIPLVFYIVPVAYQLREYGGHVLLPQRKMKKLLDAAAIRHIDTTEYFHEYALRNRLASNLLYNYGDPMHLSERGHAVLADKILSDKAYAVTMQ